MQNRHEEVSRLYEELGPVLPAYARSLVDDATEAEDALQEVFVKLLSGREQGLPREPRPYVFRANGRGQVLHFASRRANGGATRNDET